MKVPAKKLLLGSLLAAARICGEGRPPSLLLPRRYLFANTPRAPKHTSSSHLPFGFGRPLGVSGFECSSGLNSRHSYSTGISMPPDISDSDVKAAFKELMASSWDDISDDTINKAKKALSKSSQDKAGQEALANVFRAAEASVEFTAILVNIRMALEERTGLTGESVTELPPGLLDAITIAYKRYMTYVSSFSPSEAFLRKKVEAELGTRLIHLKQRVSGLGSEWGEINVIGTSGLSGSYVEQRA